MSYEVSARRWRPQTFEEVVGQQHVASTLKNAITNNRIAHAYLFSGKRGVGKTTMARILAKALNCQQGSASEPCNACDTCREITLGAHPDVIEIDGASNTSVDDVRQLRENVRYAPSKGNHKIYIVDEVHMLSKSAFNAFLKTLEEPPPHTVFIFATTESRKIPDTILSRCQCFVFKGLTNNEITNQLKKIAVKQGIDFKGRGIELISRRAEGGMRDALVSFDQAVSYAGKIVEEDKVRAMLGVVGFELIHSIMQCIIEGDIEGIVSRVREMEREGTELKNFCRDFLEHLRNLTVCKMVKDPEEFICSEEVYLTDETRLIMKQAEMLDVNALQFMFRIFLKTEFEIRQSSIPSLIIEMGLIRMTTVRSMVGIDDILLRLNNIGGQEVLPRKPQITIPQPNPQPVLKDDDIWERIKEKAGEKKPRLGGILEHTMLCGIGTEEIIIGFKEVGSVDYYREGVKSDINLLSEIICEITGKDLKVVFREREAQKEETKKKVNHDNEIWKKKIVQDVLEYFPGVVAQEV